jgi:hypothetical protein
METSEPEIAFAFTYKEQYIKYKSQEEELKS